MTRDDGGPAFPRTSDHYGGATWPTQNGMSLRDWFAAAVLSGIYANRGADQLASLSDPKSLIAEAAYRQADAMLAERAKVKP